MGVGKIHRSADSPFEIARLGQDTFRIVGVPFRIDLRSFDHHHETLFGASRIVRQDFERLFGRIAQVILVAALHHRRHVLVGEQSDHLTAVHPVQFVHIVHDAVVLRLQRVDQRFAVLPSFLQELLAAAQRNVHAAFDELLGNYVQIAAAGHVCEESARSRML